MSKFERYIRTRHERKENQRLIDKNNNLKNYLESKDLGVNKNVKTIIGKAPGYLKDMHDLMYSEFAKQQDAADLLQLEKEIEIRIKNTGNGVLIKRLTKMTPDPAGNFLPQYIGLQLVSDGINEYEAKSKYDEKINKYQQKTPNKGVCTAANPTGETPSDGPTIGPVPDGYNIGYASQLADKIMSVFESNPTNIGRITFDSIDSPIQPKAFIKEEFFFISKQNWLNRDGLCRPDY